VTVRTVSVRAVSIDPKAAEPSEAPQPAPKAATVAPVAAPVSAPETPPAKQPQPAADPPAHSAPPAPRAPSTSPPLETGSIGTVAPKAEIVAKASAAATQAARIASDVRLRAGPGNSHPVLGTIARGTAVEVVAGCRAWCEVITSEQRGWVYKGFLDTKQASP
jgi:hypothetical protein